MKRREGMKAYEKSQLLIAAPCACNEEYLADAEEGIPPLPQLSSSDANKKRFEPQTPRNMHISRCMKGG